MNGKYFDDDDFGLFNEFELMLDELDNVEMSEKTDCSHKWEKVGSSPYTGEDWINCSKCDMRKEDYDYDKKYNKPPPIKTENKSVNLWGI